MPLNLACPAQVIKLTIHCSSKPDILQIVCLLTQPVPQRQFNRLPTNPAQAQRTAWPWDAQAMGWVEYRI